MSRGFLVIPAIDLSEGRCVRLRQGRRGTEDVFSDDPAEVGRRWVAEGARLVHVVDLDGAFDGCPRNLASLESIARAVRVPVQFGGGLRTIEAVERALSAGAFRVVLGTGAVMDGHPGSGDREEGERVLAATSAAGLVERALERFGPEAVAVSIDSAGGAVRTHGWVRDSGLRAEDVAGRAAAKGVRALVVTDVERDGMMSGPNLDTVRRVAEAVAARGARVVVAGGVSSLDHVARLADLAASGLNLAGAIVGRALYNGALDLGEAIRVAGAAGTAGAAGRRGRL